MPKNSISRALTRHQKGRRVGKRVAARGQGWAVLTGSGLTGLTRLTVDRVGLTRLTIDRVGLTRDPVDR